MPPGTKLDGRTSVITGAASGIGRALAEHLGRAGSPVAICDWDEEGLAETAERIGTPVLARKLDVSDRHAVMSFAAEVGEWAPSPLGAIVNNAGVTVAQPVEDTAPEDDEWVINVNYWGVVYGTSAFLPLLKEQGSGAIANVSSVFGLVGWPAQSAYCASKHAVRGYTESLRHELRDTGLSVHCIHPGGIATNIVRNARFHSDDLGNTDRTVMESQFDNVAKTTPEKAAEVIVRGIERGRPRILIGPDAYLLAGLIRLLPARYYGVIKRLEPAFRR